MATKLKTNEAMLAKRGVLILSQSRARAFRPSDYGVEGGTVMIRVKDPAQVQWPTLIFSNQFSATSHWTFDDVGPNDPHYTPMNEQQAKEMVDFFERIEGEDIDNRLLVVHCYAGICRSSAIAAAFCKYIDDEVTHDMIFDDDTYLPNMHVYRLLEKEIEARNEKRN